ncbi:MAG: peptide chain release factor N(5)-glutamine methyltransferase [Gemmatimonadota bacterium]|nr:MAG: peptide chain release factor N(5)-glutamine methyltransferase [Gemmatimonadota bacterium]
MPSIAAELIEATSILEQAGIADPRREATAIWASLSGIGPGQVWLKQDEPSSEPLSSQFRQSVARRASGEPLAYVVGVIGFRMLDVEVDRRVLIPRPETEGLVERVLKWGATRAGPDWGVAVDVGTGSGCIALSLAVEGEFRRVVGTDSSPSALAVAAHNLTLVAPPGTAVELREGEGLGAVRDLEPSVIVSNPPYVTEAEFAALDRGVRDYEPRHALVSGPDGMGHIVELVAQSSSLLQTGGLLAIEIDCTRADLALQLAREAGWSNARVENDLFERPRYLLATKES